MRGIGPERVNFARYDLPLSTGSLPSVAERRTLANRFDILPSDSFRARRMPATEGAGHFRTPRRAWQGWLRVTAPPAIESNL